MNTSHLIDYVTHVAPFVKSNKVKFLYCSIKITYCTGALPNFLRLKSRVWMQRRHKRARLIILSRLGGLSSSRASCRGPPRALCTETGLLLALRAPPVPARGTRVAHRTALVWRVVLVLIMVRRRCIQPAFKPSSGAAIQWKKKTKSIRG